MIRPIAIAVFVLILNQHLIAQHSTNNAYFDALSEFGSPTDNFSTVGYQHSNHQSVSGENHQIVEEVEWEPSEEESPFDERIETERHDFTQSTKVVGRGVRQFEYGFLFASRNEGEGEQSYSTPELMFRFGLTDRTEFRVRFNHAWKFIEGEGDINGPEDLRLSLKHVLTEQLGGRPDAAVELRTSAPTGSDEISTGRWQGGLDFIYGWEFRERFSFTASTGVNGNALGDIAFIGVEDNKDDRFLAWTQSAALGAELTEKSTAYFEWFGIFTNGRDDEASLSFLNVGLDRYINDNILIDFRVGWGLNDESDDVFAGIGGAFRF